MLYSDRTFSSVSRRACTDSPTNTLPLISLNARDWFRRDNRHVVTVPLRSFNVAAAPTTSQSSASVYGTTVQIVRSSALCVWSHWLTLRRCLASRIPGERCASTVLCNKTKSRCRSGHSRSAFVRSIFPLCVQKSPCLRIPTAASIEG